MRTKGRIVVIDDEVNAAAALEKLLQEDGYEVSAANDARTGLSLLEKTDPDIVLTDLRMPGMDGLELLTKVKQLRPETMVILMTAYGTVKTAVRAMKLGAEDYVAKPIDFEELEVILQRVLEKRRLLEEMRVLRERVHQKYRFENLVGESPDMLAAFKTVRQVAPSSSSVLLLGESGTGKELFAQALHQNSPRKDKPFIKVACAALPETLLESELFGHEKGSFTGAAERRLGRFELANGGTILLDEVGEMPPATQVKLLRVLEDRSFFRVGGTQPIKVDVRVISATNKSLKEAVSLGTFRDDLFYRLNVLSVYLPPLRERRSDIPLLVRTFITEFAKTHDRTFRGITPDAMQILVDADWPGNVRQLKNLIESMVVLAPEGEIRASDIPRDIRERTRALPVRIAPPSPAREVAGQELEFIFRTLVELKMQLEDLRGRIQERPSERVEVIEVGGGSRLPEPDPLEATPEPDQPVIYKPGMSMSDVERAAIDAALRETHGNRRKAAETLGIGERTLYRKLKEYAID